VVQKTATAPTTTALAPTADQTGVLWPGGRPDAGVGGGWNLGFRMTDQAHSEGSHQPRESSVRCLRCLVRNTYNVHGICDRCGPETCDFCR